MAMACFRFLTLPPLPPLPERSVPRFLRRIALSTVVPAALPYLRRPDFLREPFLAAIWVPPGTLEDQLCEQVVRKTLTDTHKCIPPAPGLMVAECEPQGFVLLSGYSMQWISCKPSKAAKCQRPKPARIVPF